MRGAAFAIFDADRAPPVEQDACRQRVGHQRQIRPPARLLEIAGRGRPAAAVLRRQLEIAGAFLLRPVEIVIARNAGLFGRGEERFAQRVRLADVGHRQRTADAVQIVFAALLVLGAAEIGQHVTECPAGVAELAPVVEIFLLAADIEEAVDRARTAQHLAARLDDLAVVELRLRLALVEPIDLGVVEQLGEAERNVDPHVAVVAAGFQEQHAVAARCGQPVGKDAARRAGADHDVIEACGIRELDVMAAPSLTGAYRETPPWSGRKIAVCEHGIASGGFHAGNFAPRNRARRRYAFDPAAIRRHKVATRSLRRWRALF